LKVINAASLKSESLRQRFIREARSAAKLRHRNVASVIRLGTEGDTWYYAMEFIDGETLEAIVKQEGPLTTEEALEIAAQVARALNAAAQRGLVHRDIKPSNVMLIAEDNEVVAKVIDFGLAKATDGEDQITLSTGGFIGTAQFASPEQLEEREIDGRSDIYSLGATLWFMLTGQPPFRGSLAQVMHQHLAKPPPFDELAALPPEVIDLLRRMLEKDPAKRFQTPLELRKAIEGIQNKLPAPEARKSPAADQEQSFATLVEAGDFPTAPLSPEEEESRSNLAKSAPGLDPDSGFTEPTPEPTPEPAPEPAPSDPGLEIEHSSDHSAPAAYPTPAIPRPTFKTTYPVGGASIPGPQPYRLRRASFPKNLPARALPVVAVIATLALGVEGYFIVRELRKPKIVDTATPIPKLEVTPGPKQGPSPSPSRNLAQAATPLPTRGPIRGLTPAPAPTVAPAGPNDKLLLAIKGAEALESAGHNRAALESYLRIMKEFPEGGSVPARNHIETLLERLRTNAPLMTTDQFESMRDLIEAAGRKGVLSAMLMMGQSLRKKAPGESYEWFRKAADMGDPAACDYVGNMLVEGIPGVVVRDPKKAQDYLQRAAEKGYARSKAALGQYYLEGLGGMRQEDLGVGLLREAVAGGDPHAMNVLGDYLAKKARKRPSRERRAANAEFEEAFNLFSASKDLGDLKALANLGALYMQGAAPGARGPDYQKAVALFAQGAKYSDPLSMYSYARCLEAGIGIKKDPIEAKRWEMKAAQAADKDFIKWSSEHNVNLPGQPGP
jgi:serine/threonine protein kinase/TPR repeat protein